jgi:DNA polymerase/3'-5' exonuclease PolX
MTEVKLDEKLTKEIERCIACYTVFDKYRALGYEKLLQDLKDNKKITSKKMIDHLEHYKKTGKLCDITNDHYKAYMIFMNIKGVGPIIAKRWVDDSILTLADLKKAVKSSSITLTNMQKYGLKFYDELSTPIKRSDVNRVGSHIIKLIKPKKAEIVGSYRRQKQTSSDIDICCIDGELDRLKALPNVVILSDGSSKTLFLWFEFNELPTKRDEVLANIEHSRDIKHVYHVDIIHATSENYGTMLLYSTGSKEFNIQMRKEATHLGLQLSEWGLYKGNQRKNTKSEKDVFLALGLKYIDPQDRNGKIRL